jgi:hypothetical protein
MLTLAQEWQWLIVALLVVVAFSVGEAVLHARDGNQPRNRRPRH